MLHDKWLPDNFTTIRRGKATIIVRKDYKKILSGIDWQDTDSTIDTKPAPDAAFVGRGNCKAIQTNGEDGRLIVRRYRHGGLLGIITGDLFWNYARPLNELLVSEHGRAMGMATLEVVAIIKHQVSPPFFRADLITREITGAIDLIRCVKEENRLLKKKRVIIRKAARAIRVMHDIGIYHGDLHLKNLLVKIDRNDNVAVYIIDMDKSVLYPRMDITKRMKNLHRLDRSVVKLAASFSALGAISESGGSTFPISTADRVRFAREYTDFRPVSGLNWRWLVRSSSVSYRLHKLWWRISR